MVSFRTGLDIASAGHPSLAGRKAGLICHPASVDRSLRHAADVLKGCPGLELVALFGPQHGVRGEKQDNMIESEFLIDRRTGLPVHSLYGEHRKPTPEMLAGLDVLLFDLQDVGVRVYTFTQTMTLAMQACAEAGVHFVVLDRPNPIGGTDREGRLLKEGFESFVGHYPVPLRHGLSLGEFARLANEEYGIGCSLEVVACEGWSREQWHDETGLPWVFPSPNLPTLDSCAVYPGMVLVEGCNLSEGRGTTRPFELVGAPYLDADEFAARLNAAALPGAFFRPCWFEPTFQKHARTLCGGVQIHVESREELKSVEMTLAIFRAAVDLAPEEFAWGEPPYEYEEVIPPIDILWGDSGLREGIDAGASPSEILAEASTELSSFSESVEPYLLY